MYNINRLVDFLEPKKKAQNNLFNAKSGYADIKAECHSSKNEGILFTLGLENFTTLKGMLSLWLPVPSCKHSELGMGSVKADTRKKAKSILLIGRSYPFSSENEK